MLRSAQPLPNGRPIRDLQERLRTLGHYTDPSDGVFVIPSPTAVVKGGPNPNAAKLFMQFMISPVAQKMIADNAIHSSRVDIAPPKDQPGLKDVKFIPVDIERIEARAKE